MILVSGYVTAEQSETARRLGLGDVVLKPYTADEFARTLEELAGGRQ